MIGTRLLSFCISTGNNILSSHVDKMWITVNK